MPPRPRSFALLAVGLGPLVFGGAGCATKSIAEAEANQDVAALAANPTGDSIAALGRLADKDPKAVAALQGRAGTDLNVYIAAWSAVTRNAPWGATILRGGLGDPSRADLASSAMPRQDPLLVQFVPDLDAAIIRLAAGRSGAVLAGILGSVGAPAHASVEKRLLDPKTRAAMCEGLSLPEASPDAKATLLAVPPEARDAASCVNTVIDLAQSDDTVLGWIATSGEPGLLGAAATSSLACPRLAILWKKALSERPPNAALTVPLSRTISRCSGALDPVLGDLLTKAPRARPTIVAAIDPFGNELAGMTETCRALKKGSTAGENAVTRERASDAVQQGCRLSMR